MESLKKSHGILWNPIGSDQILWDPMAFYGILWNPMEFYGILWNPMESDESFNFAVHSSPSSSAFDVDGDHSWALTTSWPQVLGLR